MEVPEFWHGGPHRCQICPALPVCLPTGIQGRQRASFRSPRAPGRALLPAPALRHSLMVGAAGAGAGTALCRVLETLEKEEIDHPNNSFSPCSIHDRKCLQKQQARRVNNGNKMRSSGSPHHREDTRVMAQGSCQSELHRALERLAASQTRTHEDLYVIPIPNCDRNGNFHPKQCHPALDGQRGKCWCVDRKTGVKLPGFLELKGDLDCHQLADSM
uniref:Insulin like growth factor binding protein 4 n=1 Tax=Ficedula albicollis TaxID=59894 RepID=A0A803W3T2_FICAL